MTAKSKKVLILGLDGARPDTVLKANTPNIDKIAKNGHYSWNAKTEIRTISGAAWTSLLTGVHMNKHNVFGNDFKPRNLVYKTLFKLLKEKDPNIKLVAHSNWKPIIANIFEPKILNSKSSGTDKKMTKHLIKDIKKNKGDLYFYQSDEIDGAGHKYSYGPDSPKYIEKIEEIDGFVGDIMNVVESRLDKEEWLIFVVSDHGGSGTGHGKPTLDELKIVFIVSGTMISNDKNISSPDDEDDDSVSIVDMVPTIAKFLDFPFREEWDGEVRGL